MDNTTQHTLKYPGRIRISVLSRVMLFICSLGLVAVLFYPLWQIDLMAPQYPEGLKLLIYPDKLGGNVDIINGLNHYIGMKTLHTEDFMEFKILPGIIIFFAACFLLVAILGRRKWMNILLVLFISFGIIAMADFWRWEYNYGHNLDPNAAIIVPGMAYQPPLIGFKQLLNFGAYSIPDIGGWIFVGVGAILLAAVVYEWRRHKKTTKTITAKSLVAILMMSFITGCSNEPQPIRQGKDTCVYCRMTVSDTRFAASIITKKSKQLIFDDVHCLKLYLRENNQNTEQVEETYFIDFANPGTYIKAGDAFFLQSPALKSPMNGNVAAFSNEDSLNSMITKYYGNKISWEDLQK